jgi:molybdate/tungstate transport system substrate-binding protein
VPFRQLDAAFQKAYPDVVVQSQFGGSVMMTKRITELHQQADLLAVADYSVIPKYLSRDNAKPMHAEWFVGFARNAVTFAYTRRSKFFGEIKPDNWHEYLARPGVQIGRSNPDTDPSGYQAIQMLALAESYYRVPDLAARVLANAPLENTRDTETNLIAALQLGQIDYLAIYRSDALQHHLDYFDLPAAIDLSDPAHAADYARAVAHTKNGDLAGNPIVYAITIPSNAEHPDWAEKYLALLLGPEGQQIMARSGFRTVSPAFAVGIDKVPAGIRARVRAWPGT